MYHTCTLSQAYILKLSAYVQAYVHVIFDVLLMQDLLPCLLGSNRVYIIYQQLRIYLSL